MIKVVSFDVGNTIIKSSKNESLKQIIRRELKKELDFFDIAYKEHFITNEILLDEFCDRVSISKERLLEIIFCYQKKKKPAEVWNDVYDVLSRLRKENIEIIVSSNKTYVNPYTMKTYGLDKYFKREFYSCDVGFAKPDICFFSLVTKDLDYMPNEMIHIGDSLKADYFGAIHAGWKALLLDRDGKVVKTKTEIKKITGLDEIFQHI